MAKKLQEYNRKRDFSKTAEPKGEPAPPGEALRFVVQRHDASRLHYDFRLEYDGVLWSWAVPKGPSYNPRDKRLAVHVEDHPLDYRHFEGNIPKGEYGGGTVQLFDEGIWIPEGDPARGLADGSLKFTLQGQRLIGRWTLVRMKPKPGEEDKNWLLIKEKDEFVRDEDGVTADKTSVRSGRTLTEIAKEGVPTSFADDLKTEDPRAEDPGTDQGTPEKPADSSAKANPARPPDLAAALPFTEIKPMLATLTDAVPKGPDWIHELKFDGYRILAFLENDRARLISRNGHNWSAKAPGIVRALEDWAPGNLILDGELVVFDKDGKSDFQALQSYFKQPQGKSIDYVVFDLLAAGSTDLTSHPLIERKTLLESLLADAPAGIHFSHHTLGGAAIFEKACASDLEGIISKKKDSSYRSSRSQDWVKVKCERRQEFVIGGYTVTESNATGLSALLLGTFAGNRLVYAGRAGTGFSRDETRDLLKAFSALRRKTSPFDPEPEQRRGETVHYLTPRLLAEVQFAEVTDDGLLRHAAYKGLRQDKPASEVHPEAVTENEKISPELPRSPENPKKPEKATAKPTKPKNAARSGEPGLTYGAVQLSSPDKVLFPEDELTKQAVAEYYWAVREMILPYLTNRPMTLVRCTESIGDACFFQKHQNHQIQGMDTVAIKDNDGDDTEVMIIRDGEGLMGAVQMGALEFHGWGSTLDNLEKPDWLVFDLDPDEGMEIDQVRQGVRHLKTLLDEMELEAYLKTSGGKGYHVVVPLSPAAPWDSVRDFAKLLAQGMESRWPDRYTANMRKERRKGRIYVDWVRNGRSATSVSTFSLRARRGAPIAWPLRWSDLDQIKPNQVTLSNWKDYRDTLSGWSDFFDSKQKLKS